MCREEEKNLLLSALFGIKELKSKDKINDISNKDASNGEPEIKKLTLLERIKKNKYHILPHSLNFFLLV